MTVRLHWRRRPTRSKSGIMVRASDNTGAANVAVLGTAENGLVMQVRPQLGERTNQAKQVKWSNGEPVYLRLIRQGRRVTGQYSADGRTWTNLATVDVDLPEQVLVGIASTAHNTA